MVDLDIDGCTEFFCRCVAGIDDLFNLIVKLLLGMGAYLTGEVDLIGDDICGSAALNTSDVGSSLRINTAEGDTADGRCSNSNCVDAFFRFDTAVGCFSVEGNGKAVLSGTGFKKYIWFSGSVQSENVLDRKLGVVKILCTV